MINKSIKKLNRLFSENVKSVTLYTSSKLSHYCSNKDPVPFSQKANFIYRLTCPVCVQHYIGITDRSLAFRPPDLNNLCSDTFLIVIDLKN